VFQEQVMRLSMVAAGFSAGQADQLRRAMASWRKHGGLEPFEQPLIEGMLARGLSREFAERLYQQILGFGEYGFPESHAASFALLVYVSAWLKCHAPAAFLCALLNSQPMGFYAPAQLIQDARRHGVVVHGVDVSFSQWESTLEAEGAVRLGFNLISGLEQAAAQRLCQAREAAGAGTRLTLSDLAHAALLDARTLDLLAQAGAFESVCGDRHQAFWQARGARPLPGVMKKTSIQETAVTLTAPALADNIFADYQHLGFTLGAHPVSLLRATLSGSRFNTACQIQHHPDRALARALGLVICRQRPPTAGGVVFLTLEDETGHTPIIVHPFLAQKQRREWLTSPLLGVFGQVQRKGNSFQLIAKRLVDYTHLLAGLSSRSRDLR
jgi:error-prone DNA polymerase